MTLVVSGVSLVAPFGTQNDIDRFLGAKEEFLSPLNWPTQDTAYRFDRAGRCDWANQAILAKVNMKLHKQADRSTLFAMHCLDELLEIWRKEGGHGHDAMDGDQLGLFIASQFGGMDFSERELAVMITKGAKKISTYQAISWFYAATQGQWTIARTLKGFAKSLVGDSGGFIHCLTAGDVALRQGRAKSVFCGAVDCCVTPYAQRIIDAGYGMIVPIDDATAHCAAPALPGSEGGAFFWLVPSTSPSAYKNTVVLRKWGSFPLWEYSEGATADRFIKTILDNLGNLPDNLLIMLDGTHTGFLAGFEQRLSQILMERLPNAELTCPKRRFGNAYAGAMPIDLAIAIHWILGGLPAPAAMDSANLGKAESRPTAAVLFSLSSFGILNYLVVERHGQN